MKQGWFRSNLSKEPIGTLHWDDWQSFGRDKIKPPAPFLSERAVIYIQQ
jgi:hypothetical protein